MLQNTFRRMITHRPSMVAARSFSAFPNHRDTPDNLESSPFEYSDASMEAIKVLLKKYPDNYKSSAVIPALFVV